VQYENVDLEGRWKDTQNGDVILRGGVTDDYICREMGRRHSSRGKPLYLVVKYRLIYGWRRKIVKECCE
jgi:hypothetical protein